MNFNPLYGLRRALVALLLLLMALAPAMAFTVVYEGATTQLNVQAVAGNTYAWEIYDDATVNFALVQGKCPATSANFVGSNTGASININWLKPGIYFYKVTARDATQCAMNMNIGMIKVLPFDTKAVITGATITGACNGVKLDGIKSTGDITKYEWSLIDSGGELSSATGISTEFLLSSTYKGPLPVKFNVKLLVTDVRGKTDFSLIAIEVGTRPKADVYLSGKYEADGTMIADGSISTGTKPNYNWYTMNGGIVGPDNQQSAKIYGTGTYTIKITDIYNCPDEYSFPVKFDQIIARADYARISWAQVAEIDVLNNDDLPENYSSGPVKITKLPLLGEAKPNADGTVTYTPRDKHAGHDQFDYQICDAVPNCSTATVTIDIYDSPITLPEGFSPNGDGKNDLLNFEGLDKYGPSQLTIFTRTGAVVYTSDNYDNKWGGATQKGTINSQDLVPTGTYYYILRLGATNRTIKGFVFIAY